MAAFLRRRGVRPHRREMRLRVDALQALAVRRVVDDPEYGAARIGLDAPRASLARRGPQLGEAQSAGLFEHDRLRLVLDDEDRAALRVVAGGDSLHSMRSSFIALPK